MRCCLVGNGARPVEWSFAFHGNHSIKAFGARRGYGSQRATTFFKHNSQYIHSYVHSTIVSIHLRMRKSALTQCIMSRRINCEVRHMDQAAPHSKIVAVLFLSRTALTSRRSKSASSSRSADAAADRARQETDLQASNTINDALPLLHCSGLRAD